MPPPQVIVTNEHEITVVLAGIQGPPGQQGEQGEAGTGGSPSYATTFTEASLSIAGILVVNHNLNKTPSEVAVWDSTGDKVYPDNIEVINANTIAVSLPSFRPLQGTWTIAVTPSPIFQAPVTPTPDPEPDPEPTATRFDTKIGFNLDSTKYYSTVRIFKDLFSTASFWIANSPSTYGVAYQMSLDAEGYPATIPANSYADRIVSVGGSAAIAAGRYVVLWQGDGYDFGGANEQAYERNISSHDHWTGKGTNRLALMNATLVAGTENLTGSVKRCEFDIPADTEITFRLKGLNPGVPLRNVRILAIADEATYADSPFAEFHMSKLEYGSGARTMDLTKTNNSALVNWANRPTENYAIQQADGRTLMDGSSYPGYGVSYELVARLANTALARRKAKGASKFFLWVCIPDQATDDYAYQMGRRYKQTVDPDVIMRVEWSNEIWNTGLFQQAVRAQATGQAAGLGGWDQFLGLTQYSGRRHRQVWQQFKAGWDSVGAVDSATRVITVAGGWVANPDYNRNLLDFENCWQYCDEIAIAPYFYGSAPYYEQFRAFLTPQAGETYGVSIDGQSFTYTVPGGGATLEQVGTNIFNQVEASTLITNPSSKFAFVKPHYQNVSGTDVVAGFKLFYKLQGAAPTPAVVTRLDSGSNASEIKYVTTNLSSGWWDDSWKPGGIGFTDRARYEAWVVSLTAEQIIAYCMAEVAPGGYLEKVLQSHQAMLDSQTWTKKPKLTYYELGPHLYAEWISDNYEAQFLATLQQVEESSLMQDLIANYLNLLAQYSDGVIPWFALTGEPFSKWGSWGLFLPQETEKWKAVVDWIAENH